MDSGFNNLPFIEEMYDRFKSNPAGLDPSWRKVFENLDRQSETKNYPTYPSDTQLDLRISDLINAYRTYGHLLADTNPLPTPKPEFPLQLRLERFGLSSEDLRKPFPTCGLLSQPTAPLEEILATLNIVYCGKVGVEYMGLDRPEVEKWLQQQIEPNGFQIGLPIEQKKMILEQLNKSELLELFLQMKYTGQKRFSLEGGETLIPILAAIVEKGAEDGVEEFVLGMAHRGRLNVLTNILNKSYATIFSEFDENYIPESFEGSGDVKYHKGYFSDTFSSYGHKVQITLTPNPSHLEGVDPVVEGQAFAKQFKLDKPEAKQTVMPVLIHGDAALSGQGVIYETMQMYNLEGYGTGGTVHVVINNQIGFTTTPADARSTRYCTDIARAFNAPVFHVNAEDPESCVYVTILAVKIRQMFHCDVFIDLISWRKYGHNETDEPAFTQPLEYQIIRKKTPIRELYRDHLISQGYVERSMAESLEVEFKQSLQKELTAVTQKPKTPPLNHSPGSSSDELNFRHFQTGVPAQVLREIATNFCAVPKDFTLHPKLINLIKERLSMVEEGDSARPIDWGMAETLAYGSLLWEGTHVRLSGQDSCRGTFSHRHAMWMDQKVEQPYYALNHLKKGQGRFSVFNSPLSEYAVLGFELGYSLAYPNALVLWEAQFGDFCNGAQVVIDQFISTGEQKWGQQIALVMLLPHGYEGQGPEHSSARMERFLTLSGHNNLLVVNPSTPAQLFHLLRRQVIRPWKKPLVVFTPKGLLRNPACVSHLNDLTSGSFQEILDDPHPGKKVQILVLCSGRIYYDLIEQRSKTQREDMAIIRVEQLYPFNKEKVKELFDKYKGFTTCIWAQEEPNNMGAGNFMQNILRDLLPAGVSFQFIARPRSASPAVGSHALHKKELEKILSDVFGARQPSIFEIAGKTKKT